MSVFSDRPCVLVRLAPINTNEERQEQEVSLSDASSGPSVSGLGSALPRPQVLQTLPGTVTPLLPDSPPPSPEHPLSLPFDGKAVRKRANEQWMHLKQLCVTDMISYDMPMQARLHRTRRIMVSDLVCYSHFYIFHQHVLHLFIKYDLLALVFTLKHPNVSWFADGHIITFFESNARQK